VQFRWIVAGSVLIHKRSSVEYLPRQYLEAGGFVSIDMHVAFHRGIMAFTRSVVPVQCVRLSELTFIESLSEAASFALRWFREMGIIQTFSMRAMQAIGCVLVSLQYNGIASLSVLQPVPERPLLRLCDQDVFFCRSMVTCLLLCFNFNIEMDKSQ